MLQVILVVVCFLTTLAAVRTATAQAVRIGEGELHATSYQKSSEHLPAVVVRSYDDAALDLLIRDQMIEALRAAGCNLNGPDAPFELALSSQIRSVAYEGRDPSLGKLSVGGLNSFKVQANVWSSSQDSILAGRKSGSRHQPANEFEIEATLRDRRTGTVVWQGRAIVPQLESRFETMVPDMITALAANLGRTVHDKTFPIYDYRAPRAADPALLPPVMSAE